MEKIFIGIGLFVVSMILGLGIGLLLAFPLMWLWNYLVTTEVTKLLFGIDKLNFWRSLALMWLCGFLFKPSHFNSK